MQPKKKLPKKGDDDDDSGAAQAKKVPKKKTKADSPALTSREATLAMAQGHRVLGTQETGYFVGNNRGYGRGAADDEALVLVRG